MNLTGDNIDPLHLRTLGEAANQLKYVKSLTTGVCITTQLRMCGTEQPVKMQMQQPDSHSPSSREQTTQKRP